jgi:hypothetical protein
MRGGEKKTQWDTVTGLGGTVAGMGYSNGFYCLMNSSLGVVAAVTIDQQYHHWD